MKWPAISTPKTRSSRISITRRLRNIRKARNSGPLPKNWLQFSLANLVVKFVDCAYHPEATAAEIISAGGTTVAVRVNLADDLDVQRLYTESIAAFGGVDVVVHTTTEPTSLLYQHAARRVREQGAIVSVAAAERIAPEVAWQLRERGITVGTAQPEALLSVLARWRRAIG